MNTNPSENSIGATLRLLPSRQEQENGGLPILTTAADIRELIQYLKRRPAGVIAAEELDRPKKRLFEDRKLAAYEFLGITTREGQTLRLTSLGWNFAQRLEADAEMFRHFLDRHAPYFTALTSMALQNIDMITSTELSDLWLGTHAEAFAFADQEAIRGSVISFFSLCQAAGLGTMVLGKRGHITRFFVDRDELTKFLDNGPKALAESEKAARLDPQRFTGPIAINNLGALPAPEAPALTVLIQCKNPRICELIQRTLEVAGLRGVKVNAIWDRTNSTPAPENISRESCALLAVLGGEASITNQLGTSGIKQNLLFELGAAQVLYDRRVIVLADKANAACEGIKDLICYEFENEHLDWEVGLQLIKRLSEFQESVSQPLLATTTLAPNVTPDSIVIANRQPHILST